MRSNIDHGPEEEPLIEYKVYVLDEGDHIAGPAQLIEAINDEGAIETAIQTSDGRVIEIWDGARLVIRLYPDGSTALKSSIFEPETDKGIS